MSFGENSMMFKKLRSGLIAAALGLGTMAGAAEAAPVAAGSTPLEAIQSPVQEAAVVVVHRRPVVRHHRRRVCWWSHGRRICRWR
jgi:hypothetical protein